MCSPSPESLPSGHLLHSYWWPSLNCVCFPIKKGWICPYLCNKLPEGIPFYPTLSLAFQVLTPWRWKVSHLCEWYDVNEGNLAVGPGLDGSGLQHFLYGNGKWTRSDMILFANTTQSIQLKQHEPQHGRTACKLTKVTTNPTQNWRNVGSGPWPYMRATGASDISKWFPVPIHLGPLDRWTLNSGEPRDRRLKAARERVPGLWILESDPGNSGALLPGDSKKWLVVSNPLNSINQLGWLYQTYGKIKNVPNHQPVELLEINGLASFPGNFYRKTPSHPQIHWESRWFPV